ncbi:methyltransferase domain-containing protein [Spirochaetia bacterium 38H-sp]|uniref:Methyltransferase domain-containing protein n=1 Tax=Rarispira pelagica TaxID=3141764 RepID=A0ABU9UAL3_9SPIR
MKTENNQKKKTRVSHKAQNCLGPIDDLRAYLNPDWWRSLFGSLYLKTDGDVVCDENITKREVDVFSSIIPEDKRKNILDICCGQGRHCLEFSRRGFENVNGIDRSRYLIKRAKANAEKENLQVYFREGDARKLPYRADSFDVVTILGNSFGYFESEEEDLEVLRQAFKVLKPQGIFILDVADGEYIAKNYEQRSWEWIDKKMFVCRERVLDSDKSRLICREVITNVEKGVIADQVYSERLYTAEKLIDLLKKSGFSNIELIENLDTSSARNQDLGMMARRLIIRAISNKEWTPVRRKQKKSILIPVLLGDPRKTDIIKPDHVFDEDDIKTIEELKKALSDFNGRDFVFIDDHEKMFQNLIKMKPNIGYVFNLCDEGFHNDPFKELHVPAMLEALDIPYTGSPPHTLAICYDKSIIRGIARDMGIPIADGYVIPAGIVEIGLDISYPIIIKPNYGDSSFGIWSDSVVNNEKDLLSVVHKIRKEFGYDKPLLLEEFLPGKDLTIGIIGQYDGEYRILPIIEEDYSAVPEHLPRVCGYEAKWCPDSPYWKIKSKKAELPSEIEEMIVEWSLLLSRRVMIRDYVRLDWRLDSNGLPRLLEINPNPGWCWDGHLAKAAAIDGLSYSDMLKAILRSAEARIGILK